MTTPSPSPLRPEDRLDPDASPPLFDVRYIYLNSVGAECRDGNAMADLRALLAERARMREAIEAAYKLAVAGCMDRRAPCQVYQAIAAALRPARGR